MRAWVALVLFCAGCATVTYDGPRRRKSQVSRISGGNTFLKRVDGDAVEHNFVEVLPGEHKLDAELAESRFQPPGLIPAVVNQAVNGPPRQFRSLPVCFTAFAGRTYEVRVAPSVTSLDDDWQAAVFDRDALVNVEHPCRPKPRPTRTVPRPIPPKPAEAIGGAPAAPVPQNGDSE
jgi:hypothetical protein